MMLMKKGAMSMRELQAAWTRETLETCERSEIARLPADASRHTIFQSAIVLNGKAWT